MCNAFKVALLLASLVANIYVTYELLSSPQKCNHFSWVGFQQSSTWEAMVVLMTASSVMYLTQYNPHWSMMYLSVVCRLVSGVALILEMICIPHKFENMDSIAVMGV